MELDDGDVVEANEEAGMTYPLAHRCVSSEDWSANALVESALTMPHLASMVLQKDVGAGLDTAYCALSKVSKELTATRISVVSGVGESEKTELKLGATLPEEFKLFRKIANEQVKSRCLKLDKKTLLALRFNPSINTFNNGVLLKDKQGWFEIMEAEYKGTLRARYLKLPTTKPSSNVQGSYDTSAVVEVMSSAPSSAATGSHSAGKGTKLDFFFSEYGEHVEEEETTVQ
eukprot:gene27831-34375_t